MAIKFSEGGHWYGKDGTPQHDADLRVARKLGLYPSVTTIDKAVFKNDFLERWKIEQVVLAACENHKQPHENNDQYAQRLYDLSLGEGGKASVAASFGSWLHDALDKYPIYPEATELHPWIDRVAGWAADNIVDTYHTEITLLDHDLGVAGRCDRVFKHRTLGEAILDWKTQDVKKDEKGVKKPAFYESWVRQLAFYAVAYAKGLNLANTGLSWQNHIPACISVVIDSNEPETPFVKIWDKDEVRKAYDRFIAGAWLWFEGGGKRKPYWPRGEWSPFDSTCPPRILC